MQRRYTGRSAGALISENAGMSSDKGVRGERPIELGDSWFSSK